MLRIQTVTARIRRPWSQWDRGQRRSVVAMVAAVAVLHLIGWGVLILLVAPGGYTVQGAAFGVGLGATAYTLGMRHAFDADHIAAIDNTTRKLVAEKKKPVSVGFWFSLGHSTVVFAIVALVAVGVRALSAGVEDPDSGLQRWTGVFGTGVSGTFLILIGLLNLVSLVGIWRVLRRMRQGEYDEQALEQQLDSRGALTRFLGPLLRAVRSPWQMYPVGLLFGLGFDTVTEVGLLVLAGGAAATDLPWYAIIVLPVLFSAGMSLFDSLDGAYMNYAYGWAFAEPVRKIYYNVVVTGLSVTVALLIGAQEIISILAEKLDIAAGPLAWIGNLDLGFDGLHHRRVVRRHLGDRGRGVAVRRCGATLAGGTERRGEFGSAAVTRMSAGVEMFARYAHAPNALGYCGPTDTTALATGTESEIRDAARKFSGAWPYLRIMASMTGVSDPLDRRLVESYWLGGGLGAQLDSTAFLSELLALIGPPAQAYWRHLTPALGDEARANHSFHVFGVYPWSWLLGRVPAEQPVRVLDSCRITWARVCDRTPAELTVRARHLRWDGHRLTLSPNTVRALDITGYAGRPDIEGIGVGDHVALHWDHVCGPLDLTQLRTLAATTARQLQATNRRLAAGPGGDPGRAPATIEATRTAIRRPR